MNRLNRFITVLKRAMHKNRSIYFIVIAVTFLFFILLIFNINMKKQKAADDYATYKDYFYGHYEDNSCSVLFCDLTHDGMDEMIVLQMMEEDLTPKSIRNPAIDSETFRAAELLILQVKPDSQVNELFKAYIAYQHSNWGQIYLYKDNGKAYLVNYNPYTMGGTSHYSFSVYYFSEEGVPIIFDTNQISFSTNEGEPLLNAEDDNNKVMHFEQAVQGYIRKSRPLIIYYEDINGRITFDYFDNAPKSIL